MAGDAKEERDVTRTRLAAERTWLAWWRTGVAVGAVALAVGRVLPGVSHGAHSALRALGIAYAALAIAVLFAGAWRQRGFEGSLRDGEYAPLSSPLVSLLTAVAIGLCLATLAVVAVSL